MCKCKNCGEETKNNNIYCSYKCRNIYVNKNIRDYSKVSKTFKEKKRKNEKEYYQEPKKCKECNEVISYNKKENMFCCGSCSTSYTNKKRKSNYKYKLTDEGRKILIESANKNLLNNKGIKYIKEKELYSENYKKCLNCDSILEFRYRNRVFCNIKCKKDYYSKNRTDIENYKKDCQFKFNLKDYENEFNFKLIEQYGWYKAKNRGDNLGGVSRDHMYSVMGGFRNNIEPKIILHPANCKLMIHNKNVSKSDKCSITIEKLEDNIKKWNLKYKLQL